MSETVELLQALIRSACVNDGTVESGQETRNVAVLQQFFGDIGVDFEVVEPAPGRASLIGRLRGTDPRAPSVALVGHLDVVPADPSGWTHDPFGGELIDGTVWGRGAIDMLGLVASMAVVFKSFAQSKIRLRGDLVFAATADEEAGGTWGAGWITKNRPELIAATYSLTENGGIVLSEQDSPGVTLTVGEKGGAPRRLEIHGRPGHGSTPWGARNAAGIAAEAVARLLNEPGQAVVLEHWQSFVEASDFSPQLRARLLDPTTLNDALSELGDLKGYGHAMTHMTVSPNIVDAGDKRNVIPGRATVGLDIRLLPGQDENDVERHLKTVLDELLSSIDVIEEFTGAASSSPPRTEFYSVIEDAMRQFYPGAHLVPMIMPGGTDGRHLRAAGSIVYGFGLYSREVDMASFRSRFHGDDERVDVESIRLTTAALEQSLKKFLVVESTEGERE